MTFGDALESFVEHYNAAADALSTREDGDRTPAEREMTAALNYASSLLIGLGLLPAPFEGCGECDACQANAAAVADNLLAELGFEVSDDDLGFEVAADGDR